MWSVYVLWTLRASALQGEHPILKMFLVLKVKCVFDGFWGIDVSEAFVPESLRKLRDWCGINPSSVFRKKKTVVTMTKCHVYMLTFVICVLKSDQVWSTIALKVQNKREARRCMIGPCCHSCAWMSTIATASQQPRWKLGVRSLHHILGYPFSFLTVPLWKFVLILLQCSQHIIANRHIHCSITLNVDCSKWLADISGKSHLYAAVRFRLGVG